MMDQFDSLLEPNADFGDQQARNLPCGVNQLMFMARGQVEEISAVDNEEGAEWLAHVKRLSGQPVAIPTWSERDQVSLSPLVELKDVTIAYGGQAIFENLNWAIGSSEHWRVTCPNGAGKTSLLQLITGDHPQCYVNDVRVFGFKRGSGESIWDVKRYIGVYPLRFKWRTGCRHRLSAHCSQVFMTRSVCIRRPPNLSEAHASIWLERLASLISSRRLSPSCPLGSTLVYCAIDDQESTASAAR